MLPDAAPGFDAQRMLGTWHILVTNYGFWKKRRDPTVSYDELPTDDGVRRWKDTLRFSSRGFFGGNEKEGLLRGVDRELSPGRFLWRGEGLLRIIESPWWVLMQDDDWAVTYFGRSNVGTAPGMDLYARTADFSPAGVRQVLARVRQHPFLRERCAGLYAPERTGLATNRYDLA